MSSFLATRNCWSYDIISGLHYPVILDDCSKIANQVELASLSILYFSDGGYRHPKWFAEYPLTGFHENLTCGFLQVAIAGVNYSPSNGRK